jgi:hypothetical protein
MPIFGIGAQDEVTWQQIDTSSRDMEFQYLSDNNARVILSAFQMSPEELPGYAHLCLHPDSVVWTQKGASTIGELLGDQKEVGGFSVWTGKGWSEARAFVTGDREVRKTTIGNGIVLTTSPEHRFRVVSGTTGELEWRHQRDLCVGDTVLVNRHLPPGLDVPSYQGCGKVSKSVANAICDKIFIPRQDSLDDVRRIAQQYGVSLPSWVDDFYQEPVVALESSGEICQMVDIEVFDDIHAFVANGIVVHNSRGTNNQALCLAKSSTCITDEGLMSIGEILENQTEVFTKIWTGTAWAYARVFLTGDKPKVITTLWNGSRVESSPDHRFRVIGPEGQPCWVHQRNLKLGDSVLVNRKPVPGMMEPPKYNDKELSEDMMEVLGWMTGDGNYAKRLDIQDRHDRILSKFGLERGDPDFNRWLSSLGFFSFSTPAFVHILPVGHRQAFLKGLLSTGNTRRTIAKQIRNLLMGLGIRLHEGRISASVVKAIAGPMFDKIPDSNLKMRMLEECSQSVLERNLSEAGIPLPEWMKDFYLEEVVSLEQTGEMVEMADVEVFDNVHAFITEGVVVHNSESNSEYKLEAHRDLGIRPLIALWEDFLNTRIFPLIDPDLSKIAAIKFVGLDADTPEKEAVRIQQDAPLHMTYDEILQKVAKKPLGAEWAGSFPFNAQWQAILDKYFYVNEIIAYFFKKPQALQDQSLHYIRDPFWFQNKQLTFQQQQLQAQQQQAQQQAQAQQQQQQAQQGQGEQEGDGGDTEIGKAAGKAQEALGKSERQLVEPQRRKLVTQQSKLVDRVMGSWKKDSKKAIEEIVKVASQHVATEHKE